MVQTFIRPALRWMLGIIYLVAGWFHLTTPATFLRVMPDMVPAPEAVVLWTGIAEILGAIALLQPWSARLRRAGAIGLALYALCVWPANIKHFALDMAQADSGLGLYLSRSAHDRAAGGDLAGAVGWRRYQLAVSRPQSITSQ